MKSSKELVGIYFQSMFPVPGWGLRNMGLMGWQNAVDWARSVGMNACMMSFLPQHRPQDPDWTLSELRRFYHGGVTSRPDFEAENLHFSDDPSLSDPETISKSEIMLEATRYARVHDDRLAVLCDDTSGISGRRLP